MNLQAELDRLSPFYEDELERMTKRGILKSPTGWMAVERSFCSKSGGPYELVRERLIASFAGVGSKRAAITAARTNEVFSGR